MKRPSRNKSAASALWRDVLGCSAGTLTVLAMTGGLVHWLAWLQIGIVAGIVVGLIAPTTERAAITAAAAGALGALLGPANAWVAAAPTSQRLVTGVGLVVVSAAVAAGIRYIVAARLVSPRVLVWLAVAVIVANMWGTTLNMNTKRSLNPLTGTVLPSFNDQLAGAAGLDRATSDNVLYFDIYKQLRAGKPYYETYRALFTQDGAPALRSVVNLRMPEIFYFWAALPGPAWIVYAFLALASAAIIVAVRFASTMVKMPLTIPAAAALAAYFAVFPVQMLLFSMEAWGAIFAIFALGALAASLGSQRWRELAVTAAVAAVCATVVRETLVFVPFAGAVSALFAEARERVFRAATWIAGALIVAAAYLAHYLGSRAVVDPSSTFEGFSKAGFGNAVAALDFATDLLGRGGWLPFALALLGLVGAAVIRDRQLRVFALMATVAPLVAFLFISNAAIEENSRVIINYWGAGVVPLLYACIPVAFALVPGAAVTASAQVRSR